MSVVLVYFLGACAEEIRESDLLHHFKNSQTHPSHSATPLQQNGTSSMPTNGASGGSSEKGKAAKPPPDVQLDKAISILEHWNKYKVELAKADDSTEAGTSQ